MAEDLIGESSSYRWYLKSTGLHEITKIVQIKKKGVEPWSTPTLKAEPAKETKKE